MTRAMRAAPEAFGEGKTGRALRFRSKAATGVSSKGPLPVVREPDVVEEMERSLEWATRDVPEEECA